MLRVIVKRSFLLLSIFYMFNNVLFAQIEHVKGERLSIAHGLSGNDVRCLLQDRKGFLWIGTVNGLNRYDGYTFKIFRNDPSDSTSLSHNYVVTMSEDRSGTLWIGTEAA